MKKELFNLSEEMLQLVDNAAKTIESKPVVDCAYNCICCGSGHCCSGAIATDFVN